MESETIDPRSLLSNPVNFEGTSAVMDIPGTGFAPVEFENTCFDKDFGMTKPGLTELGTVGFGMLGSSTMDAGLTWIDPMYPGSTNFEDLDLTEIAAAPADSNMLGLDATDFGISGPGHGLTTPSDTMNPGKMACQITDYDKVDINMLEKNIIIDDTMTYPNTTGASNLNLNIRGIEIAGDQQTYSLNCTLPLSAAGQRHSGTEVGHTHIYPRLPRQIFPGGSAERQRVTSENWREYQPKCLTASAARAKITTDDWEEYRPFINQLYIVENVKLKDVMRILETRFNFVATYVKIVYFSSTLTTVVLLASLS